MLNTLVYSIASLVSHLHVSSSYRPHHSSSSMVIIGSVFLPKSMRGPVTSDRNNFFFVSTPSHPRGLSFWQSRYFSNDMVAYGSVFLPKSMREHVVSCTWPSCTRPEYGSYSLMGMTCPRSEHLGWFLFVSTPWSKGTKCSSGDQTSPNSRIDSENFVVSATK